MAGHDGPERSVTMARNTQMRQMGLQAVYPRPRTILPSKGHCIYPYRLRGLTIDRPNHVWATDISYGVPGVQGEHGSSNGPRAYLEY